MNYYEILNISPAADFATIKAAYRTLMFKFRCHPDLGGSETFAREINEAYQTLRDPEKRLNYNSTLSREELSGINTKGGHERRKIPRINIQLNVTYFDKSNLSKIGRIVDLSSLGCRMQTKNPLAKDESIRIEISGHEMAGTVRWKRMFHPSVFQRVFESGIEFTHEFEDLDKIKP